jgi:hypothetical protein
MLLAVSLLQILAEYADKKCKEITTTGYAS